MSDGVAAIDVTGRMSAFASIFAEEVGIDDPAMIPDASALIAIVKERVPRSGASPAADAPVFEAAAFIGEWLRARGHALWVVEGSTEPHLQLTDPTHAIVVLLPLVSLVRTSATAGYDGLPALVEALLDDVSRPAEEGELESLRVVPAPDHERVLAWVRRSMPIQEGARASLWRRCAVCGEPQEESVSLPVAGVSWEADAALAATMLANRPFQCACGGAAGATTRFLMVTAEHGAGRARARSREVRFCDLYATPTHSRVASWLLPSPTHVVPFDSTTFGEDAEASEA